MLHRVALVKPDVSEECIASIIRVIRIGEEVMMDAKRSFETSVLTSATRRNISEDGILHSLRREKLKSYILPYMFHLKNNCWYTLTRLQRKAGNRQKGEY
jgi:hypothetical protein